MMENLMENASPPMRLSRMTLLSIFKRTRNRHAAIDNPQEFAVATVKIIKAKLADQLVDGIKYTQDGSWYEVALFNDEFERARLDCLAQTGAAGAHLGDGVLFETDGVERPSIHEREKRPNVKLYIRLPDWFQVDTPIGRYYPDWAVVMDNPDKGDPVLYLLRAIKLDDLRPDEQASLQGAGGISKMRLA